MINKAPRDEDIPVPTDPARYRQSMSRRWMWFALSISLSLSLASARIAHANMARSSWSGEQHGPLMAEGPTDVRVDSEELSFILAGDLASAQVIATYHMTNGGAAATSNDVAFVFVRGEGSRGDVTARPPPSVSVDGAPVQFRAVTPEDEQRAQGSTWTKLPNQELGWLVFPLDFAPGQERLVEVRYSHVASSDHAARVNPTFDYRYLLSPAKSWASFGALRVRVQVPAQTQLLSSTIALRRSGDVYQADLAGLPEGELSFEVSSQRGLWLGMTSSSSYLRLVALALALITVPLAWFGGRSWRRARPEKATAWMVIGMGLLVLFLAGAVVIGASELAPRRAFGFGYDGILWLFCDVLLAVLGSMVLTAISARKRSAGAEPAAEAA
jgi:hypothetical protein